LIGILGSFIKYFLEVIHRSGIFIDKIFYRYVFFMLQI